MRYADPGSGCIFSTLGILKISQRLCKHKVYDVIYSPLQIFFECNTSSLLLCVPHRSKRTCSPVMTSSFAI